MRKVVSVIVLLVIILFALGCASPDSSNSEITLNNKTDISFNMSDALEKQLSTPNALEKQLSTPDLNGEWFVASQYNNRFDSAVRDNNGFIIRYNDGEIVYSSDGSIAFPAQSEENLDYKVISNDMVLYYEVKDHILFAQAFLHIDNEWRAYSIEGKKVLFLNDAIIPSDGEEKSPFYCSGDNMYLAKGNTYIRGKVQHINENAFIFQIDADPYVVNFSNGLTVNYGTPFYLFIRSSIME